MDQRANASAAVEVLGARYQLDVCLGAGNMGSVWRAYDLRMGRHVAIKRLHRQDPETAQRFERELQALARLAHANIVSVFDTGTTSRGEAYLVMELVSGVTLAERLRQGGPLQIEQALDIASQIAKALRAAHAEGIVHRDLKPSNIMLSFGPGEPDRVKLLDFGVARLVDATQQSLSGAHFIGTPLYASPEQAKGDEATASSDLYCLGSVLFEMLVGRPPFKAETALGVLFQHAHAVPPLPSRQRPELPEWLDELISSLLAKQASERPSADDLLEWLDARHSAALARRVPAAYGTAASAVEDTRERQAQPASRGSLQPPVLATAGGSATAVSPTEFGNRPARGSLSRGRAQQGLAVAGLALVAILLFAFFPLLRSAPEAPGRDGISRNAQSSDMPPATPIVVDDFESPDIRPSGKLFSHWEGYSYLSLVNGSGSWQGTALWKGRAVNSNRALRFGWRVVDPADGNLDYAGAAVQVRPANDFVDLSAHSRMVLSVRYDTDVGWPRLEPAPDPAITQALADSLKDIPPERLSLIDAQFSSSQIAPCEHAPGGAMNVSFQCREHGTRYVAPIAVSSVWTTVVIPFADLKEPRWGQTKVTSLKACLSVVDIITFGAPSGPHRDGACHSGSISLDDISIR